jgi:hypothetical protein
MLIARTRTKNSVIFLPLDPGWKITGSRSAIKIHICQSLVTTTRLKKLNIFVADSVADPDPFVFGPP